LITLRDVQAWTSEEVCLLLEISPENQRRLLHRARSSVRQALESYLGGNGPSAVSLASESGET
jgi:RNA polymerase sigma-70 factor (ECF subfamily)